MAFIRNTLIAVFGISVGLACGPEPDLELSSGQTIPRGLVEAVEAGEAPRAVVLVGEPGPMGWAQADALDRSPLVRKSARFHALTEEVARSLTETDLTGVRRFEHLPMMVVDVEDVGTLYRLAGAPNVIGVYEDEVFRPSLTNSLNLIGQPTAAAAGATGAGATVAVLDTGTDYTRAAFGSCSAPGESGCKVVHAQDFAPSDGVRDDNGHGTNVSGIVLGVAPDALVADLDVFRSDGLAYSSDIISAIDWIIANQQTHNIVAMNLSLGGGSFDAACPTSVFAVPFANARAAGVLPVVASGNDGFTNAVASPACVPTGVSVGATYATSYFGINWANCTDMNINPDEVTCFSNSSSTLTMLAPGALITAAGLTQGGTSQAAPHVAGAVAVLKQAHPSETIEDSLSRMLDNGVAITDPRNGLIRPRLDLNAALNAVVADTTAPSGTVVIEGNAAATRTSTVSLTLSASDNVAVTEVCLSSQSGCSEWLPYATSRSWVLSGGDGVSNVYALFRDAAGNTSPEASDSILLDTVAPTAGVLEVTASGGTHTLSWSGATDDGSGIASYTVVHAAGSPPNDCLTTTPIYSGTAQSFAYGSPSGQTDGYRVCAVDAAGNVSPGAFFTYVADANSGAPEGTVLVEDGTGWVRSTSVRMDFTVTDPDGVAAMCISNTSSCTAWRGFSARHYHQLASAEGTQTIYVWFRDTLGNESPTPVATAVQVDSTAPVDGTATSVGQDNAVEVSWSGFADTESGITGYRVVTYRQSYAPPTCEHGTVVFEGPGVSAVDSGATNGSRIAYRVCARNAAGLSSAGTTTLAIPRAESDAPTGVIQVDEGTGWVRSTSVLLSFTVTDPVPSSTWITPVGASLSARGMAKVVVP
ncbi:MAG: S8 family serine peptidase, partial [Myxococcota bacterium]